MLETLGDGSAINISGAGTGNAIRHNYVHDVWNPNVSGLIRTDDHQVGTIIADGPAAADVPPKNSLSEPGHKYRITEDLAMLVPVGLQRR